MEVKAVILDEKAINRALIRISHEIIEKNDGVNNIVLVGIETRGVPIAKRLANYINTFENEEVKVYGMDISHFRDDRDASKSCEIYFEAELCDLTGKDVVLVDDVLYTGRTARAGIEGIIKRGRPNSIQLATLIDRGHRELPIRPDFVGKNVPTSRTEAIKVFINEVDSTEEVVLLK